MWRIMRRLNPRRFQSEDQFGPQVLVLITTGRKSGRLHRTPLQYELIDGRYYIGSARGIEADWFCNLLVDSKVRFELLGVEHHAFAEAITDPVRIADFLELRLENNPRMIGLMMRLEGLPKDFTRAQLEEFASQKAIVVLHPETDNQDPITFPTIE
jgi:hypothetical protein